MTWICSCFEIHTLSFTGCFAHCRVLEHAKRIIRKILADFYVVTSYEKHQVDVINKQDSRPSNIYRSYSLRNSIATYVVMLDPAQSITFDYFPWDYTISAVAASHNVWWRLLFPWKVAKFTKLVHISSKTIISRFMMLRAKQNIFRLKRVGNNLKWSIKPVI